MKPNPRPTISTIDSHFSFGTNSINFGILLGIAERSMAAKDRPDLPNLMAYYNAITEMEEVFLSLLPKDVIDDFEKKSSRFLEMYHAVADGTAKVNLRNMNVMLFILKDMRYIVTNFMQTNYRYFYRVSTRPKAGLNNLDHLITNNIFKMGGSGKNNSQQLNDRANGI